ncbi:MAG TPA: dihydrolipoamide acetyltransferase family protein [Actinomycetota bacterium]|nr:dihydrolipoamide acetyltransferase family protein [Actinomycetota bacterium]
MGTEIKMPQLGETVVEGTITKWLKQEGDQIEADDLLVEISTDKVDSEVPSSASGTLQKILVQEGDTVKVGTPLAIIGEDGEAAGDSGGGEEQKQEDEEPKQEAPEAQQEQPKEEEAPQKADAEGSQAADGSESEAPAADQKSSSGSNGRSQKEIPQEEPAQSGAAPRGNGSGDTSKRGIISPLVRRLADEHGVDLGEVEGSGTGGRIRKQDVLRFVEERKSRPAARATSSAQPAPEEAPRREPESEERPAAAAGAREELVPWTNIRRRTAEHMVAAHLETARAWNAVEADWSNIAALRARVKDNFKEREGFSLTYMPFLCKVVCDTLMEMPEVNSSFDEANQANLVKRYVNLGIAVALEGGGLIVPVIKAADEKNLVGLARAVHDVATRARTKKLTPDDLAGGTFTITNPGPFGSIISVPIIPRGQTGILGFEAIQKRVVVTDDDAIAVRSMGFLSMSWDHRTIDGAEAARWLARLRERIETTDFTADLSQFE